MNTKRQAGLGKCIVLAGRILDEAREYTREIRAATDEVRAFRKGMGAKRIASTRSGPSATG